jgi:hypothetical protein
MTLDESIQGMRLQVMRRAGEIGVSTACREAGISRTWVYRWQHRLSRYGVDGLHPRRLKARPGPAPQLSPAIERRLLVVAIVEATWARRGWPPTPTASGGCAWRPARPSPAALDRSLRGFMHFYNFDRPHHGLSRPRPHAGDRVPWRRGGRPLIPCVHSGTAELSTPTRVWTL